ncbi:hypothetical protein SKAU_G00182470 [Synaphobranchus kaupii]|uniref:Uncharacterized protein n=1 Tax=Synaphobranchus kaupii TaxID=118154 RepID=A0A9Q1FCB9_SYNKA|nr:hypothetical protein SKAU_G00182470 [Synaphobranchus kaupii]
MTSTEQTACSSVLLCTMGTDRMSCPLYWTAAKMLTDARLCLPARVFARSYRRRAAPRVPDSNSSGTEAAARPKGLLSPAVLELINWSGWIR